MSKSSKKHTMEPIHDKTLVIENVTDRINDFLRLLQITEQDIENVKQVDSLMKENVKEIAERHYQMIMMLPEIREIFEDHTYHERYTNAIIHYFKEVTNPSITKDYVEYRRKIGEIHSRIHLTDEWYIGSYLRVYEYLLPIIAKKFRHSAQLPNIITSLVRIISFDSLIVLGSFQDNNDYLLVRNISKVMEHVISADKVKSLLDSVNTTVEESSIVTSATQQLTSSLEQINNHVSSVASNAVQMKDDVKEGQKLIENTLNEFLQLGDEFETIKNKMDKLNKEMSYTTEVIDIIKNIAEETNLLALNASIEAARAGEHGKGFAVVASEVRKLSEETKKSVEQISNTVYSINNTSNTVATEIQEMSQMVENRVKKAKGSIEVMSKMIEQISYVGDSIHNITTLTNEQAKATEDIQYRMESVHEHLENIKTHTENTGESIYKVSTEVDRLRNETINYIPDLTSEQLIRVVQTEHALYQWWAYNAILGFHDANQIDNESCRFSAWYHKLKNTNIANLTAFKKLEKPHESFHRTIDKIKKLLKENKNEEANILLIELNNQTIEVIALLRELQDEIK